MTRDDIIQMAREACWEGYRNDGSFVTNEFILGSIDNLERFYKKAYEAGAKAERNKLFGMIKQVLDYELTLTNKFLDSNPKLSGFYQGIYDLLEHLKERMQNES